MIIETQFEMPGVLDKYAKIGIGPIIIVPTHISTTYISQH